MGAEMVLPHFHYFTPQDPRTPGYMAGRLTIMFSNVNGDVIDAR
jgi:hypothetical protein